MDDTEKRFMQNLCLQVKKQSDAISEMQKVINSLRVRTGSMYEVRPFGIKDISTMQLYDAFQRGLNIEQLVYLANGKYTQEQIYKKLEKYL